MPSFVPPIQPPSCHATAQVQTDRYRRPATSGSFVPSGSCAGSSGLPGRRFSSSQARRSGETEPYGTIERNAYAKHLGGTTP